MMLMDVEHFSVQLEPSAATLGIHVMPAFYSHSSSSSSSNGGGVELSAGMLVHRIEPSGRVGRDARIRVADRIVRINEHALHGVEFAHAQRMLRAALANSQRRLELGIVRPPVTAASTPASTSSPTLETDDAIIRRRHRPPPPPPALSSHSSHTLGSRHVLVHFISFFHIFHNI